MEKCYSDKCDENIDFFNGKRCKLCDNSCCFKHIQPENHDCPKVTPVKHLRKTWLRKYDQNISSGLYIVVCDQCGYVSENPSFIDIVDQERVSHIQTSGCNDKKIFLEEYNDNQINHNTNLEKITSRDEQHYMCTRCDPPRKFSNEVEYKSHNLNYNHDE